MSSIAKLALAASLTFNVFGAFAQESQAEAAAKWQNGEKALYGNWGTDVLNLIEKDEKVKVEIIFGPDKKVTSVKLNGAQHGGTYDFNDAYATDFVRYYGHYYTKKLYFTGSSIIIYELKETLDKTDVKVLACVGKKINQKDVNNLVSFLTSTKKYWVPINIDGIGDKVAKINVIPIYLDGNEELLPNEKFELEFEVELEWGVKIKSQGLKGNYSVSYFKVSSNDITIEKLRRDGKDVYSCVADCPYIQDNKMNIEGTLSGSSVKFSKTIPVNCDLDQSPGLVEARKWSQYSQILFKYTENGETKKKDMVNENGFNKYADWFLWLLKNYKDDKTFLLRVTKDGKVGYTDVTGKVVIPFEYEGGAAGNTMTDKMIGVSKGGKWGYINLKNEVVVAFKYESISDFKNGMGKVYSGEKVGFVNAKGIEVVKPLYDKAWNFANGAAVVMKDNKYGFVNENGAVLGGIVYDDAFDFDENKFGYVKNGEKHGVIDLTGKLIVPIDQSKRPALLNKDLIIVEKLDGDGQYIYGVINRNGKMVFDYLYSTIYSVGNGTSGEKAAIESQKVFRVILKKNGKYGFLRTDGTVESECIFFSAQDFFDGNATVGIYENDKYKEGTYNLETKRIQWDDKPAEEVSNNNSSNSNSNNSTKPKAKADSEKKSCFIINDLTQAQLGGKNTVKLGFTGFRMATSYIARGKTMEVDCDDVWVYKLKNENSSERVKGYDLFNTKGKCGETIKLSDYW